MNLDSEFYTTGEVMAMLGVNRRRVSAIAKRRAWRFEWYEDGQVRGKRYAAAAVEAELQRRRERETQSPKTITIKCPCGQTFQLSRRCAGKATCPGCGMEYRATWEGIFWKRVEKQATPAPGSDAGA